MAVMELLPTSRKGMELNMVKLINSYSLMTDAEKASGNVTIRETQKMIDKSKIL